MAKATFLRSQLIGTALPILWLQVQLSKDGPPELKHSLVGTSFFLESLPVAGQLLPGTDLVCAGAKVLPQSKKHKKDSSFLVNSSLICTFHLSNLK